MTPLTFALLAVAAIIAWEAMHALTTVGASSAPNPSGTGLNVGSGGNAPISLGSGGPYTAADVYNSAIAHGLSPADANNAVYIANRETGFGANMGPACCKIPHEVTCSGPGDITDGWDVCARLGNEPHYGIFQWGQLTHPDVWATPQCLGNLDCEMGFLAREVKKNGWGAWAT